MKIVSALLVQVLELFWSDFCSFSVLKALKDKQQFVNQETIYRPEPGLWIIPSNWELYLFKGIKKFLVPLVGTKWFNFRFLLKPQLSTQTRCNADTGM